MRVYKRDDMDLLASADAEGRDERIRELVDDLPEREQLAVSLFFFGAGSPTMQSVAADMGVSEYQLKGILTRAKERLAEALQEEDGVGPVPADVG